MERSFIKSLKHWCGSKSKLVIKYHKWLLYGTNPETSTVLLTVLPFRVTSIQPSLCFCNVKAKNLFCCNHDVLVCFSACLFLTVLVCKWWKKKGTKTIHVLHNCRRQNETWIAIGRRRHRCHFVGLCSLFLLDESWVICLWRWNNFAIQSSKMTFSDSQVAFCLDVVDQLKMGEKKRKKKEKKRKTLR